MIFAEAERKRFEGPRHRVTHIGLGILIAFVVLAVQLWRLQLIHGFEYRINAERNRLHPQRLTAPRGVILGRNGEILADNRAACDLVLVPAECQDAAAVCDEIEELLDVDAADLRGRIDAAKRRPFEQILVKRDVAKSDLIRVEERAYALHGVYTVVSPQRRYVHGTTAGQILGYLGEIGPDELEQRNDRYSMGDYIGRDGIEQTYEENLRGVDGNTVVTRYAWGQPQLRTDVRGKPYIAKHDTHGHELEEAYRVDPVQGGTVQLTLDIDLQAKLETILVGEVGAIVVIDADTGAVLGMASTPSYDPSVFVTRGSNRERAELLRAGRPNPMVHRAFRETYPPGSVFKVLLACAALEEGLLDEHMTFYCPGFYQIDGAGRKWHCWKRYGHGTIGIVNALAFSCDVFFYNVGRKLGPDLINEYAAKLGLGACTGIDLPREEAGLIPSREWKKEYFKAVYPDQPWEWEWRTGDTLNTSIGQGSVAATPLQTAVLMAAVVNGGYRVRPYLNAALGPQREGPFLSERTVETVRQGLFKCVDKDPPAPTGTGNQAKIPGMTILGKTGSAQVVSLVHHEDYETEEEIPYHQRDHAWFVAGVLDREPRVAISILVEHGHHGSSAAAPFAKEIIEFLYRDQPNPVTLAQRDDHP
ncbi:MAG TPA: penicillin-binding protein 2 [Candidatus Hydrogenedentes bacterium]|nr:penicillin-binding protein 2 [Candidatus Hydrogenedentota bacterium]HPG66293.1 penicillin-binding protein 2 [Candidatus Hydrogenedentota bacterium]